MTATFASICGIIVLAFPISMIVEKFAVAQEEVAKAVAAKAQATTSPPNAPGAKKRRIMATANFFRRATSKRGRRFVQEKGNN